MWRTLRWWRLGRRCIPILLVEGRGLWVRVQQYFAQLRGLDHGRTVDALSSRFRVIRLDCETFERYYKAVEDSS
ncbi:hypothetical protein Hanom_Chr06g00558041 [Helianthus anomalus]